MTTELPDVGKLALEPRLALWQGLASRLLAAVFAPEETGWFAQGWSGLFRDEGEAGLLARDLSTSASAQWGAPVLRGARGEPLERGLLKRRLLGAPAAPDGFVPALGRWFAAGLSESLETGLPDHYWILLSRHAWSGSAVQHWAAYRILEHLRSYTLMYPMSREDLDIALAPETFWCLLLLAASFHTAERLYRLTWWNRLLRFFRLPYQKQYVRVEQPLDQLRLVAERVLASAREWAGPWDQFILAGACRRWDMQARWSRLSPAFAAQLRTLECVAAVIHAAAPPAAAAPEPWSRPCWEEALPDFLRHQDAWQFSAA
jgi:hypothetical protein